MRNGLLGRSGKNRLAFASDDHAKGSQVAYQAKPKRENNKEKNENYIPYEENVPVNILAL